MAHHPPVELEALLLCEAVTQDPGTGRIISARFPGPYVAEKFPSVIERDLWAVLLLGRVRRPTAVRILMRREHDHPDAKPLLDRNTLLQRPVDDVTAAPFFVNMKDVTLPTPGEYLIHAMVGEREVGMRRFHAIMGREILPPPG